MNWEVILIIILSVLSFSLGIMPYIIATIKGNVKPNKITWILWSVPMIGVFSQWQNGILTWASLPVFLAGFGPFLVFLASFYNKKSYWKLKKFDYFFALFAVITLILQFLMNNATLTIIFAIITDALAAIPTLRKAYKYPDTELITPFLVFWILTLVSFLTMERYDFEEMFFPIYLLIINFIFIIFLRKQLKIFFKKK